MSAAPAKTKKAKKPATHPKYIDMVKAAIGALKERSGSSRQKILKYVNSNYKVNPDRVNKALNAAIRKGLKSGALVQVKGSFKLGAAAEKKKKPKAKKPKATKVAKPKAKKPAKAKKTGEKKAKSPAKKAKKPKAAKKPAAPKPAKAKKPKSPAKKAAKPKVKKPAKKSPKKAAKK